MEEGSRWDRVVPDIPMNSEGDSGAGQVMRQRAPQMAFISSISYPGRKGTRHPDFPRENWIKWDEARN